MTAGCPPSLAQTGGLRGSSIHIFTRIMHIGTTTVNTHRARRTPAHNPTAHRNISRLFAIGGSGPPHSIGTLPPRGEGSWPGPGPGASMPTTASILPDAEPIALMSWREAFDGTD